ncbi:MAG: C25 family cysteine peptidase [Gammaproteobacteria bacterium]|nr:C25 family cysteine peptidase [Gammaproteobacteria bacterium]
MTVIRRAVRHRLLGALASALAALLVLAGQPARAATVPTGFQEYHVIGNEQHVWTLFNRPVIEQGGAGYNLSNAMLSVVSITVSSASQIIYYDHWEDNSDVTGDGVADFEQDIVNAQTQPRTLVLGDGNPANGDACTYIAGPCAGDIIALGDTLTLNSNVNTGSGAAPNCGGNLNFQGCVPVNPRNAAQIRFDGGDRIVTSGGPVSLVHVQEPTANLPGILGGAVEIVSRQAIGPATSYSVPVGENSPSTLGGGAGAPFIRVDLDLVAYDDNTSVQVTSPGAGTVNFTLNAGQHWSSRGSIDAGAGPAITINEGTKISTTSPLGGMIFASANGTYATRVFALLPDLLHGTDFISTAPGDDPGIAGNSPKNLYVYNPDPVNSMTVTYTDSIGTGTFNVGPNSTVAYSNGAGRFVPSGATVRLTSDRNFWGLTAYDSQGTAYDWGHSWLATTFLADTYTVPHAPDNPSAPPGASPVFVSAPSDNTCVQVDFDNDGNFDQVRNGAGALVPFSGGICATGYLLDAPGPGAANAYALRIYDNNAADGTPNNDITGARVVANKPVALSWGLDTDSAPTAGAGLLDLGYWIYPVAQRFLDPVLVVDKSAGVTTVPIAGGPVTYTIEVQAFDAGPLTGLQVTDLLPAGVPPGSYVPGSTVITNPDLSQVTGAGADPVETLVGGRVQLDWSAALAAGVSTLNPNEVLTVRYTVNLPAGPTAVLTNEATAVASLGSSVFAPTDTADVVRTDVSIAKAVADDGSPAPSENLSYTITVANAGVSAETNVTITDPLPAYTTFTPGSIVDAGPFTGTYDVGQNAVVWTAASLAAGAGPFDLGFQATINPAAPAGAAITNAAGYESTQTQSFTSNAVTTTVVGPDLVVAKGAVGNPATVGIGETVTYEITVSNAGAAAATGVFIQDPFPVNGTYVPGSMSFKINAGAFTALTDAGGDDEGEAFADRVEFSLIGATSFRDEFGSVSYGNNDGTQNWSTNWLETGSNDNGGSPSGGDVQIVTDPDIGGRQVLRIQDDDNIAEREANLSALSCAALTFDVRRDGLENNAEFATVEVSANGGGTWTVLDTFAGPADDGGYTAQSYDISAFISANTRVRFSSDAAAGSMSDFDAVYFDDVAITECGALGAGQDLTLRFDVTVNTGTGGSTLDNQANVSSNQTAPTDTNLLSIPISNAATVTGRVFLDVNGNGTQGPGEPGIANVSVCVGTAAPCAPGSSVVTDANGDYVANVTVGVTSFDVDQSDVDFPVGAVLTTGNDPQNVNAGSANATPVGYRPQGLVVTKTSSASMGQVAPGDTVTYTVTITNNTGVTQNDVRVSDTLPAGLAYIAESTTATPTGTRSFQDNFDVQLYSNNDGSQNWATNWLETGPNDNGGSPTGGDIQIETDPDVGLVQSLRIQDNDNVIEREADLTGLTSAILSLDFRRDGLENANELVTVEVSANGGGTWAVLETFAGPADDAGYTSRSYDISAFIAANTRIRFSSLGAANSMGNADDVRFDNVRIAGPISGATLTNVVSPPGGLTNGVPPNLVVATDNFDLGSGDQLVVTFQATVSDPLAAGITSITNTATASSNETPGGVSGSVTDTVIRPVVDVEPNAAGTVLASGSTQTIGFLHTVVNTGNLTNSYTLRAFSSQGWQVELVNPLTLTAIATDSNGDGVWNGATPNTGSIAAGGFKVYLVRVTVPGGTPVGAVDTIELRAISDLRPALTGSAFDEITVVDGTVAGAGDVLVEPDNASNAQPGNIVVYSHTITNRTGATDIFDLSASSSQGWPRTIYRDTNGDGVYTAGVDTAISNSASLANGATQRIFVVLSVPGGASPGTVDVLNLTAVSRNNPDLGGIATDTTTVGESNSVTRFDFSGGGSQIIDAGDTPAYPGTLANTGNVADTYEFTISASVYGPGGPVADGLDHASELWIDTNADGVPDTGIARDDDGDGVWDFVAPGYDGDSDGNPDVALAAGATLAYELRRPVDPAQSPYRDPVTLTVTSLASGAADSITATTAVLLVTRAVVADFVAYESPDGVVVQWQTSAEHGTVGFHLERFRERTASYRRVNRKLLPGLLHSRNGGIYRYVDDAVAVGELVTYRLVELEATGNEITYGPYTVLVEPSAEAAGVDVEPALDSPVSDYERVERALSAVQQARSSARQVAREAARAEALARKGRRAKVTVRGAGVYFLDAGTIAGVLGRSVAAVRELIAANRLVLGNAGQPVATLAAEDRAGIYFYGEAVHSQYTEENVYWLSEGEGLGMRAREGRYPAAVAGASFPHVSHAEGNRYTLTHLFDDPDGDYWMWDFRYEDMTFPMFEPHFVIASPGVDANAAGSATLTVRLHGGSESDLETDHEASVVLNGTELGTTAFEGLRPHAASFEVPLALLADGDNRIEIRGRATGIPDQPSIFYINDFSLSYPRRYRADGNALAFSSAGHRAVSIGGFGRADVELWELANPRRPRRVSGVRVEEQADGYRASFGAPREPTPYLAFTPDAARAPERVIADVPSDLRSRSHRIDYLVITSSDMLEAAARLVDYRAGQGLRGMAVDVEDVYDEFNDGIRDADAIWAFLHHAHTRWRTGPRYVVLAGEGSFDYKNHLGHGDAIIPALLTPTPEGLFPSDNLYADVVGNDWVPEMAIGRLPVISAEELDAVTAKIRAYEQTAGEWTRRMVVAADAPDLGGDFPRDSDAVAALVPGHVELERLHLDEVPATEARASMLEAIRAGRGFVNFFGHSGHMTMGNTRLVDVLDVPGLDNGERLAVVTAFTCLVGQFGFPGQEALGEALVIAPQGGAAAVWSSSGLSLNHRAARLGRGFYESTFTDGELVLGEIILAAQTRYAREGVDKYLLDVYNLIGDPATIVK